MRLVSLLPTLLAGLFLVLPAVHAATALKMTKHVHHKSEPAPAARAYEDRSRFRRDSEGSRGKRGIVTSILRPPHAADAIDKRQSWQTTTARAPDSSGSSIYGSGTSPPMGQAVNLTQTFTPSAISSLSNASISHSTSNASANTGSQPTSPLSIDHTKPLIALASVATSASFSGAAASSASASGPSQTPLGVDRPVESVDQGFMYTIDVSIGPGNTSIPMMVRISPSVLGRFQSLPIDFRLTRVLPSSGLPPRVAASALPQA